MPAAHAPARRPGWLVGLGLAGLVLGLTGLGLLGGLALGQAAFNGRLTRWQRLPDPPEPAIEIMAGGTGPAAAAWYVFVRSATGAIFYCPPYTPGDCWVPATEPIDVPYVPGCDYPSHYTLPPAPGPVLDHLETETCNFEAGYTVNFVVLADGSVWRWQHVSSGLIALTGWLFGALCGAGLGLLAAIILIAVVVVRRRRLVPR